MLFAAAAHALSIHTCFQGAKAYEKAEDPIYALENNLPIDVQV